MVRESIFPNKRAEKSRSSNSRIDALAFLALGTIALTMYKEKARDVKRFLCETAQE
jgi:hypothetical protein